MKKNLRFLTVILLAALCLLFAGCAEQEAEPDGSAQDLLNLNDGADEVPADDGLDDTADESYPAEEDLAAFAGTYTCRTQGAEWSDLEIYDDGSWTISDAHSKSGVFVNGKQTALSALRFGDVITMGGINFTLIPLTKEQERIQAGTRTRAGHAVHHAVHLTCTPALAAFINAGQAGIDD